MPNLKTGFSRYLHLSLGVLCVLLGVIGLLIPIVPSSPFFVAAAYFFSKCSPRMHRWLLSLPYLGKVLNAWEKNRALPRYAKWAILCLLLVLVGYSLFRAFSYCEGL